MCCNTLYQSITYDEVDSTILFQVPSEQNSKSPIKLLLNVFFNFAAIQYFKDSFISGWNL